MRAFHHVLVGWDGSESARRALQTACELLPPDGTVTVVHAYEVPWQAETYDWFADFKEACRSVAEEILEGAKEVCGSSPVAARFEAAPGKPADALARLARDEGAELIVVGNRGLGAVRASIGSVTLRLLHDAPCPVLVVPEATPVPDQVARMR